MTRRRDALDRMAAAMRKATPAPDPAARDHALATAMGAFEAMLKEKPAEDQASAAPLRSKANRPRWAARLFGGMQMPTLSRKPALMGGVSLAVLGLAVVLVQNLPRSDSPPMPVLREAPMPARHDTPSAPPAAPELRDMLLDEDRSARDATAEADRLGRMSQTLPAPLRPTERPTPPNPATEAEAALPSPPSAVRIRRGSEHPVQAAPLRRDERLSAPHANAPVASMTQEMALAPPPPAPGLAAPDAPRILPAPNRDRFEATTDNPVKTVAEAPVSTFSIDVDTASYAWMRRSLNQGQMPRPEAVRIEELINYFAYAYPAPETRETPFQTSVSIMPSPWNEDRKLMHIGIQGYELSAEDRPDANLVFLIDVSGSMRSPDKLPLLVNAFRLLLTELRPTDEVAIVTYASGTGIALEPTPAAEADKILAVMERLQAGGGTSGEAGLREAYALAESMMAEGEITRVLLATDGDFNLGLSSDEALTDLIAEKRETGVFLSVLGFGEGNYNDALMQHLAQNGNGIAAYIDSLMEARKVLVEGVTGALFPIAKDVKIQIEFNPATVAEYRLIGYETRALNREEFNDDTVDAGEIGAGHSVTAIYEITPVDSPARMTDPLRYAQTENAHESAPETAPESVPAATDTADEYAFLKLRYKLPEADESTLVTRPVTPADETASAEARFAAAVAGFGQLLKGGRYLGDWSYAEALALARANLGEDPYGHRAEFLRLVALAETLDR